MAGRLIHAILELIQPIELIGVFPVFFAKYPARGKQKEYAMSAVLMRHSQQSSRLDQGRALRLDAAPQARWLSVTEGRLWFTRSAQADNETPQDCWLEAGDAVQLPAGEDAVIEAWPKAGYVLQATPVVQELNASLALKPSAALRRWLQVLRPAAASRAEPAPCGS
jgi:hypothetical protein